MHIISCTERLMSVMTLFIERLSECNTGEVVQQSKTALKPQDEDGV